MLVKLEKIYAMYRCEQFRNTEVDLQASIASKVQQMPPIVIMDNVTTFMESN